MIKRIIKSADGRCRYWLGMSGRHCSRKAVTTAWDPFSQRTLACCRQHKKTIERQADNFVLYD